MTDVGSFSQSLPSEEPEFSEQGVQFLPGRASIKDDLQAIFEMEKQIGAAVFQLHRVVHQIQATSATAVQLEDLENCLGKLTEMFTAHHETLRDRLIEMKESALIHQEKVEGDWARIQRAAGVILKNHGIDPTTLAEESEKVRTLGRWISYLQMIGLGIVITFISTWIVSSFSKALLADQKAVNEQLQQDLKQTNQEIKQITELVKRQQNELIAHIKRDKQTPQK